MKKRFCKDEKYWGERLSVEFEKFMNENAGKSWKREISVSDYENLKVSFFGGYLAAIKDMNKGKL